MEKERLKKRSTTLVPSLSLLFLALLAHLGGQAQGAGVITANLSLDNDKVGIAAVY